MMITVPLTRGLSTTIDDEDADLLNYKWFATPSGKLFYAVRTVNYLDENGKRKNYRVMLHDVILRRKLGRDLPVGTNPDHKDRNPLNNQRDNLRPATKKQSTANRRITGTNLPGVSYDGRYKKPYKANIKSNGKTLYLGNYATAQEASEVYKKKHVELHGEFSYFYGEEK